MLHNLKNRLRRSLGAVAAALLLSAPVVAQNPSSVDIDLVQGAGANQLDVRLRANGQPFSLVISNLVFTVRWVDTSPATLGIGSSVWCPAPTQAFPLGPSQSMATPGNGFKYRTYSEVATQQIGLTQDDGGCGASGQTLPADTWVTVFTINVSNNTGCTNFQITNDSYTTTNNLNFFCSLGGTPKTGTIEATGVNIGACTADCAGVIGGSASLDGCGVCSGGTTGITPRTPASATFSYAGSPFCSTVSSATPTFSGTTGGTFTSSAGLSLNASSGAVNIAASTPGTYTVTYTVAAYGTCPQFQTTASITITALPAATISYTGSPYCSNGGTASVTRTGTAGGSYSSTAGLSINSGTGAVDLAASTAGTYTVTYTIAAAGGCAQVQATTSITITALPAATISYAGSPYCSNGGTASVTRTGTAGGSYSSTAGLSINSGTGAVDLAASTAGTYTVTYTIAAAGGCAQVQATTSITINGATVWYADADGDGAGDPSVSQLSCVPPMGYVSNNSDQCPGDGGKTAPGQCGCGVADTDSDSDGTANCNDGCPNDPNKIAPGVCGCGVADTDSDNDGTANCNDGCPNDPNKIAPGVCGCGVADTDSDNDGTANCNDGCPNDPNKTAPGVCGCGVADTDSDNDGTANCNDGCPNDPNKVAPGTCGCGVADTDSDGDGLANCVDNCPNVPGQIGSSCDDGNPNTSGDQLNASCVCVGSAIPCPDDGNPCTSEVVVNGVCTHPALPDSDNDGTCDLTDGCPNDPNKIAPGVCGCGVADTDSDNDGTANCNDGCPNDPNKIAPGVCGCGVADTDSDNDGTANCNDGCPNDPNKTAPGVCGCGVADTDSDNDGTANCNDGCPNDPNKIAPGVCGCGVADTDSDNDGTANCNDGCPNDPNKIAPGVCGCGVADTDSDNDGTANCNDGCPNDPNKIAPGVCGCGVADTDSDNDGVADCIDSCPNTPGQVGSTCDDGNANTFGDQLNANCVCEGSTVPCPDDGDPCTAEVVVNGVCTHPALPDGDSDGTCDLIDGCPNDPNKIAPGVCGCGVADTDSDNDGTANCNDGCPNDPNKIAPGTCGCGVADTDTDGDQIPDCVDPCDNTTDGLPCNDGNACTTGDVLVNCNCVGTPSGDNDSDGVCNALDNCPNTPGVIGSACNDNNPGTTGDAINSNCQCVGTPIGGCDHPVALLIETDANGSQTTWEIIPQGGGIPVCSGGPYTGQDNTMLSETCCLTVGCYQLRVMDSAGDGVAGGGYVLSTQTGRRIIDNRDSGAGFTSTSAIANNEGFCLPLGSDRLIVTSCDKEFWITGEHIVAAENPSVSAQWQVGDQTNDGYEMWFFNPNGGYSFRRFHSHAVSDGYANVGATRACYIKINNWSASSHIPEGVLMNVRVRSRVNGVNAEWGPACRFRLDPTLALCPPTQLVNNGSLPEFSCGVTRQFPSTGKLWAWSRSGANKYQFEFSIPAEGFVRVRNSNVNYITLNWAVDPLLDGRTYNVRVRISKNGGLTWCTWGETCLVTINNGVGIVDGGQRALFTSDEPTMSMYPNPNRGEQVYVALNGLADEAGSISIELYDMLGAQVMAQTIKAQDGQVTTMIELPGTVTTGVYVMRVAGGGKTWTERMVVQR